jgi:hypothetical protein
MNLALIGRAQLLVCWLISGASGPPGPAGPGLQRTGFMVVRHSQSAQVPECPSGMIKLWDGYSLLMMQGNDHGYHQDLGTTSCTTKQQNDAYCFLLS